MRSSERVVVFILGYGQVNVSPRMQCAVMIIFLFLLPHAARDLS